jgi:hypothetical protein
VFPPLVVNTSLGFLLFTTHSFLSLSLSRLSFFQRRRVESFNLDFEPRHKAADLDDDPDPPITLSALLQGLTIVPHHPTLLSAIAGAGAGALQGIAFTPVENVVR